MDLLLASEGAGSADEKPLTRCGYKPGESLQAFEKALLESGAVATGRTLHFSADILCSGGYDVWARSLWDFAIDHVGVGSPRLFVYLKKRLHELDELFKTYPDETLYHSEQFHIRAGEIVIVLREVPRRSKVVWPKVGPETHLDGWIRNVSSATETEALRRVWKGEGDMTLLRLAGAELLKSITTGSLERTLFWMKWLFDHEAHIRKETKGANLTSIGRGPTNSKEVGHFIAELLAEAYKEMAAAKLIRMAEEFQCLLDLWRGAETRIPAASRKNILGILGQILCEVPRWKIPAAPALIQDPVQVSRAVSQSGKFFKEVMANPPVKQGAAVIKLFRSRGLVAVPKKKKEKEEDFKDRLEAMNRAMNAYLEK
jgi:hypothetical protein